MFLWGYWEAGSLLQLLCDLTLGRPQAQLSLILHREPPYFGPFLRMGCDWQWGMSDGTMSIRGPMGDASEMGVAGMVGGSPGILRAALPMAWPPEVPQKPEFQLRSTNPIPWGLC